MLIWCGPIKLPYNIAQEIPWHWRAHDTSCAEQGTQLPLQLSMKVKDTVERSGSLSQSYCIKILSRLES